MSQVLVTLATSVKREPDLLLQQIMLPEAFAPRVTTVLLERMTQLSVLREPTQILLPIKI